MSCNVNFQVACSTKVFFTKSTVMSFTCHVDSRCVSKLKAKAIVMLLVRVDRSRLFFENCLRKKFGQKSSFSANPIFVPLLSNKKKGSCNRKSCLRKCPLLHSPSSPLKGQLSPFCLPLLKSILA